MKNRKFRYGNGTPKGTRLHFLPLGREKIKVVPPTGRQYGDRTDSNPHPSGVRLETRGTLPRPKNSPPDCFYPGFAGAGLSNPFQVKNKGEAEASPLFLVRRKGLGYIFFRLGGRKSRCCSRRAGSKQQSTGLLHLKVRVPSNVKRKADIPNGISAFLVRRKGLEPPTY